MEMPKPSAEHRKLQRLVGEWVGDERIFPSPWDPNGGTAIGKIHNRLALDGFAVIQDYELERDGKVAFRGHGVFTWDQAAQCYILHWFDSMGMPPNLFKGTLENNILTLVSQSAQGHTRAVWNFSNGRSYSYHMDVSPDGKQWFPSMEGTYIKKD